MATLALAAVGAAAGSALLPTGISLLGATLSGAAIGSQIGALAGSYVDNALFGASGSRVVEGPRLTTVHLTSSTEGAPVPRVYGRARVGGQVIWADDIVETQVSSSSGGSGKGLGSSGGSVRTVEYRYSASFAVALCEGEISGVGRVWADGRELDLTRIVHRLYMGTEDQAADPLISAELGADAAPAFRGTAYIVFQNLALAEFGNRIPQLSFEVVRAVDRFGERIRGVVMIPGSGEFVYAGQPAAFFLDLPLLRGDEPVEAGYVAASQSPWPGSVAIYSSPEATGFVLRGVAAARSTMGVTTTAMGPGPLGVFDFGTRVRVDVGDGQLVSISALQALAGGNLAAVRTPEGEWEVFQFLTATLVSAGVYELSGLLRGQAGSEHAMRAPLAAGAGFVLLNESVVRLPLTAADVGLALNWRYGPGTRDVGDASFVALTHAFRGVGARPYAPVHVQGVRAGGDLTVSWIRRTRIGGDNWTETEVPVSELSERYEVDVLDGAAVRRTLSSTVPSVVYSAAQQVADFGSAQAAVSVRVYQLGGSGSRGTARAAVV